MSPRITPKQAPIATAWSPQEPGGESADVAYAVKRARAHASRVASTSGSLDPYSLQYRAHERYNVQTEKWEPAAPPGEGEQVPSFWHDLLLEAESEARALRSLESWPPRGDQGDPDRPSADAYLAEARERLATTREFGRYELEQRDLTSPGFIPAAGAPMFIAEEFAIAARGRAALAQALPQRPLPMAGDHIEVPRLSSGAAVAVTVSENSTVQETDPQTGLASSNKALISGQVDVASAARFQQAWH